MNSDKQRIIVNYYHSGGSILHPLGRDKNGIDIDPKSYIVDAYTVGGKEGVFAVFESPQREGLIDYAQGDDGHWWFAGRIHPNWVPLISKAFNEVIKDDE